jgi:hypothetical protein
MAVGVAEDHEPWMGLGLYKEINLNEEWKDFKQEFEALRDEENARIHFDAGGSDVSLEIAGVRLLSLVESETGVSEFSLPTLSVSRAL